MVVKVKGTSLSLCAARQCLYYIHFKVHSFLLALKIKASCQFWTCHIFFSSCSSLVKINRRSPFMSQLSGSFQIAATKGGICSSLGCVLNISRIVWALTPTVNPSSMTQTGSAPLIEPWLNASLLWKWGEKRFFFIAGFPLSFPLKCTTKSCRNVLVINAFHLPWLFLGSVEVTDVTQIFLLVYIL